jgi:hypothetical protein
MNELLLSPPIAFLILLAVAGLLYAVLGGFTFKAKNFPHGLTKPYACGEEQPDRPVRPDYGQFFPFAFFFTILHVVALTVTTVPVVATGNVLIAILYLAGAVVGLSVLYTR